MAVQDRLLEPLGPPTRGPGWLNVAALLAGAAAGASLILEHGFRELSLPPVRGWLHLAQGAAVAVFALEWFARLWLARERGDFLARRWGDAAMLAAAVAVAAIGGRAEIAGTGPLWLLSLQVYLGLAALLAFGRVLAPPIRRLPPTILVLGGFAVLCFGGSGLLMLPVATPESADPHAKVLFFVDALFTAVSAVCGVGLHVRDTGLHFTHFGQAVILALIQLGGLGVLLLGGVLALRVGKFLAGCGCHGGEAAVRRPDDPGMHGGVTPVAPISLVRFILVTALVIEAVGAVLLYPLFAGQPDGAGRPMSAGQAVWCSVFHSISAFCNAGFSLYGRNLAAGVEQSAWSEPLRDHWQVLGVMAPLIVLGGIGLPVLADGWACLRSLARRLLHGSGGANGSQPPGGAGSDLTAAPEPAGLSLHSRIALWTTAVLILVGAVGLLAVEPSPGKPPPTQSRQPVGGGDSRLGDWEGMSTQRRFRESLFLSASARTGGFQTVDIRELSDSGKLWLCGLMTVGGSPGGTAGGMKTVTAWLLLAAVAGFLRRRGEAEAFGRPIARELITKALTAAAVYLAIVGVVTLGLTMLMRRYSFLDLLFESCSACGSAGLSTGVTPSLTDEAKCLLMAGMFAGRLAVATLFLAMTGKPSAEDQTPPASLDILVA